MSSENGVKKYQKVGKAAVQAGLDLFRFSCCKTVVENFRDIQGMKNNVSLNNNFFFN